MVFSSEGLKLQALEFKASGWGTMLTVRGVLSLSFWGVSKS